MEPRNPSKLAELHDSFCKEALILKNQSQATIDWYRAGLHNLLRFRPVSAPAEIDERLMIEFLFWGKEKNGWSAPTMLGRYKSLSMFFAWCVARRAMPANPMQDIPKPKLPSRLPKALTREQAETLMETVQLMPVKKEPCQFLRLRTVAIMARFLCTGLRRQELLNLRMSDINMAESILAVRQGKGRKDRIVPISIELRKHLERYFAERQKLNILCPYVITSYRMKDRLSVIALTRMLKAVQKVSGIHVSAHILRHTFATLMVNSGCDIYALSRMLGHADIKTTMIYLNATTEHLQDVINRHPLNF